MKDRQNREVIGLNDAAKLAGVVHQTIKNWADDGLIAVGDDPEVLVAMNERKTGRKHQRYYFVDEVVANAPIKPQEDMISAEAAAVQLGVSTRTIRRISTRQNLKTYVGPGSVLFLRKEDIDKQVKGETYGVKPKPRAKTKATKRPPRKKDDDA